MRLILNPEIDVLWRDKTTLQVRNPDGTSNTISDLPSDMKLILSSCTGIVNISEILLNLNIDERIHEDINIALRFLIEHRVLINQSHLYEQSERLHKSYVQVIGINTFAFQVGQLLAAAGVGRIVFDSLTKKQATVTLGDINILGSVITLFTLCYIYIHDVIKHICITRRNTILRWFFVFTLIVFSLVRSCFR